MSRHTTVEEITRGSDKWRSERYSVRQDKVTEILQRLQVPTPQIDCFADEDNHQFNRWFGNGGEVRDAFRATWTGRGLLWMNPPYSRISDTIEKIIRDRVECVIIIPDWEKKWRRWLEPYIVREIRYPKGTKMFQAGKSMKAGTKWPLIASYVDARDGPHVKDRNIERQDGPSEKDRNIERQDGPPVKVRNIEQ